MTKGKIPQRRLKARLMRIVLSKYGVGSWIGLCFWAMVVLYAELFIIEWIRGGLS